VPWTFPLAYFGAHLAFMPVLVLLLPRRVEAIAGGGAPLALSWILLAGAVAASAGNILAGHWGDGWLRRYGSRRGLIVLGLAALLASFGLLAITKTVAQAAAALIAFQLALNLAFAPLGALLADYVPDDTKGAVAGLMGAALPASFGGISLLGWLFPADSVSAFLINGLLVAACFAPLLVRWRFGPLIGSSRAETAGPISERAVVGADLVRAWIARFLVQMGAAFVLSFLFLLVSTRVRAEAGWAMTGSASDAIAALSVAAACLGVLGAIAGGRLSDAVPARRVPQAIAAAALAASMAALGGGLPWPYFAAAYGLFQLALSGFLAINIALVAQLVGSSGRRGALLGLMNLANTVPSILVPAIVIASLHTRLAHGQLELFYLAAAGAAALASVTALTIRTSR
jgi:MFS family permease